MVREATWDDFRAAGLLWWVNRGIHLFGWAIVCETGEDGKVGRVYPARVDCRGFSRAKEEAGYEKLTEHLAKNAHDLTRVFDA